MKATFFLPFKSFPIRVMLPETDLESFSPFSRAPTKTYVVAKDDQHIRVLTLGKTMLDRFLYLIL